MIPDLSKCGIDTNLLNLDEANEAIEKAMAELKNATGGLAGGIGDLKSKLTEKLDEALSQLDGVIPEFPDIPPNLQAEFAKLVGALNDPTALTQQIANINKLFEGAPGVDLNSLLGDLGNLASIDICKAIPNVDVKEVPAIDGTVTYQYTVKGLAPTSPVKDANTPPPPPLPKIPTEVTPKKFISFVTAVAEYAEENPAVEEPAMSKEDAGVTTPPPQPPLAPPPETQTVDHDKTWYDIIVAMQAAGTPVDAYLSTAVTFTKETNSETWGEGPTTAYWRPNGEWNQVSLEKSLYSVCYAIFAAANRRKKQSDSKIRDIVAGTGSIGNLNALKKDKSNQQAIMDACKTWMAAGYDKPVKTVYGVRVARDKKTGAKYFRGIIMKKEYAQKTKVPKPEGKGWGTYSILA